MRALLVAAAVFAALVGPAHAADAVRLPLGKEIQEVVASPDGGAWVVIADTKRNQSIGRAQPDGSFRAVRVPSTTFGGILGPDGRAWFSSGLDVLRVDTALTISPIAIDDAGTGLAAAADGSVWVLSLYGEQIARIAPDGTVKSSRLKINGCYSALGSDLERAADGAMWLTGSCGLVRLLPNATGSVVVPFGQLTVVSMAADATDGIWFAALGEPGGGHVDARGRLTFLQRTIGRPTDVAVAPDGAAWFATGKCTLARAAADGSVTLHPAPIPTSRLAFDPTGIWLASPARLVHTTLDAPPGACDDTPPAVRVRPAVRRRISLAAVRRGLDIRLPEPAAVQVIAGVSNVDEPLADLTRTVAGGESIRVRLSKRQLRQVRPGKRLYLLVDGRDAEGNAISFSRDWTVRR